ncbi:hypothetical protein J437_LFUL003338, partial [Ladona fulva]
MLIPTSLHSPPPPTAKQFYPPSLPTFVPPDQPPDSDDLISWTVNIINQETFLSKNKNLFIPTYTIIRNDRPTRGGGVVIAISSELAFNILPRIILNVIEYVDISIICNNETIHIFSIYIPPRRKYTGVAFQNDLIKLFQLPGKNLFAGDWNSKHTAWGCKASNPNGNDLLKIINNLNADFHNITFHSPNQPTHIHNATSADLLDFLIAINYHHPISIQAIYDFDSDHLPIIFNLDHAPTSSPIRSTTKINWTKFHEFLQNHIHYIPLLQETTPVHIDAQTKLISDLFASAKICSSKTTPKLNHQNPKLPKHILDLISQRNRHRRHYNTYKNPKDKILYQLAKNTIRKEIKAFRNNIWNDKLSSLNFEDNSLWQMAKSLSSNNKTSLPLLHKNTYISDPRIKANIFAKHLQSVMTAPPLNIKQDLNIIHNSSALKFTPISEPKPIHPSEINNLKNRHPHPHNFEQNSNPSHFKTQIPRLILYGAPITFNTSKVNIKNIEKFYNNLIRQVTNSNRLVRLSEIKKYHNLGTMCDLARKIILKFKSKLANVNNDIINKLWCSAPRKKRKKTRLKNTQE